jgi:hypothetical protein
VSLEVIATPGELGQRGTLATRVGSIACDVVGYGSGMREEPDID